MHPDESPPSERPEPPTSPGDVPAIEDAYEANAKDEAPVEEDDSELLAQSGRLVADETDQAQEAPEAPAAPVVESRDDTADAESIPDEAAPEPEQDEAPGQRDIDYETSVRRVVVELRRIELEVRTLLEDRDTKRKRKLGGTRRWRELEEDLISWSFTNRFDEATLDRLRELIVRRHYLFRHLRYLAGTRPIWNT